MRPARNSATISSVLEIDIFNPWELCENRPLF
jgi:hypothetical protein